MKALAALLWALLAAVQGVAFANPSPAASLDAAGSASQLLRDLPPDEITQSLATAIRGDPQQAGSWLDLAVLLCQNGQDRAALPMLTHIETAFSPPPGIREVIRLLRGGGCERQAAAPTVRLAAAAQRGYDSNVNQGASSAFFALGTAFPGVVVELTPEFLPRGDHFSQVDASVFWSLPAGNQLGLQVRRKHYDRLHQQDVSTVSGVAEHGWACLAGSRCSIGGSFSQLGLGGRSFQSEAAATLGWMRQFGAAGRQHSVALDATLSRQRFSTQPNFDANLAQLRASWRLPLQTLLPGNTSAAADVADADHLLLSAGIGVDDPIGARLGGRREIRQLGVSGSVKLSTLRGPASWLQTALTDWTALAGLTGEWALQRQLTQEARAYSPGLIDTIRQPKLNSLSLALVQPIARNQRLRLEWRRSQSRDTVSLFSYKASTIALSWLIADDF